MYESQLARALGFFHCSLEVKPLVKEVHQSPNNSVTLPPLKKNNYIVTGIYSGHSIIIIMIMIMIMIMIIMMMIFKCQWI